MSWRRLKTDFLLQHSITLFIFLVQQTNKFCHTSDRKLCRIGAEKHFDFIQFPTFNSTEQQNEVPENYCRWVWGLFFLVGKVSRSVQSVTLTLICVATFAAACIKPCTKMVLTICAKLVGSENDKQTFENQCLMDNWNCENPGKRYEKIADGECNRPGPVKFVNK